MSIIHCVGVRVKRYLLGDGIQFVNLLLGRFEVRRVVRIINVSSILRE